MPSSAQWDTLMKDVRSVISSLPNVFGEVLRGWAFTSDSWTRLYNNSNPPTLRSGFNSATIPQGYDAWFQHSNGVQVGWIYGPTPTLTFVFDGRTLSNKSADSDYGWEAKA